MEFSLECYPCVLRQMLDIGELSGLTDDQRREIMDEALRLLLNRKGAIHPPTVTASVYAFIREHYGEGEFDPYRELRKHSTAQALTYLERLRTIVETSSNRLETAVKVAAAGNIVDFAALGHRGFDMASEIERIEQLHFAIFHVEQLRARLDSASTILYIADNAGETVFDRVLVEELASTYPNAKRIYAVRGGPIVNDATLQDARDAGLEAVSELISSGSIYPGTVLEETSREFRAVFDEADAIVIKGQGNFETLSSIADSRLVFALRVKCDCVARHTGAPKGSLVLWNAGHAEPLPGTHRASHTQEAQA
jgi:hypothetical protein